MVASTATLSAIAIARLLTEVRGIMFAALGFFSRSCCKRRVILAGPLQIAGALNLRLAPDQSSDCRAAPEFAGTLPPILLSSCGCPCPKAACNWQWLDWRGSYPSACFRETSSPHQARAAQMRMVFLLQG